YWTVGSRSIACSCEEKTTIVRKMFATIDARPHFDCFGDQCANIIAEENIHSHLFVLINIALIMCPSILLSISCTRKKPSKLEHTKHKKERKDSEENNGTEEQEKKTNTEQLPTTTEEKKDSIEMHSPRNARQDRKRDEDYNIESKEAPRKSSRKAKPQDRKRTKTKMKPFKESASAKHIRPKADAERVGTSSHDIHAEHKKRRDEDDRMERNTRNSHEETKLSRVEDAGRLEKLKRRESLGRSRSRRKKSHAPFVADAKDDFNRGGSALERRQYRKDGKAKSKLRPNREGRMPTGNEGKTDEKPDLQTSTAYDDFVKSGDQENLKSASIDHFDNSIQPWESCEQIQREPRPPRDRLREGEAGSAANEIDRKIQPRRFVMGEKEMQIARGSRAGRHEYKTMDDVPSDWGSDHSVHAKQSVLRRGQPKIRKANVDHYKLDMKRRGRSASHYKPSTAAAKLRGSKEFNYKDEKQSNGDGIKQWNNLGDNMSTDMVQSMPTQNESEMDKIGNQENCHDRSPLTMRTEETQPSHLEQPYANIGKAV
uniref:Uncharacterized protein n=1 Tax=Parascaris univalens TaxID=6257 RepID=A0A915BK09_PARUN